MWDDARQLNAIAITLFVITVPTLPCESRITVLPP